MNRLLSRRPSPALGVAALALFISLGGVSYAVSSGSIDSRAIKDNSVRGKDLRANSVTAREIKRRSLDGTDVKIDRVGGNAVKEQSLDPSKLDAARIEAAKLGKVPSATAADSVGGRSAAQLETRWALVNEGGQIERQTGGFAIVNCYAANANCYIDTGEDVRDNGIHAEIAVNNTDGSPFFSGDTGVAPCGAEFVACAPPGTESNNVLVVTPRASDGTVPGGVTPPPPADAARFYVFVTGSTGQ
jgi:hypothetical protein